MMRLILGYVLLFSMAAAGCTDSANQKSVQPRIVTQQPASENRIPGQYIVTLRNSANSEVLTEVFNEFGISAIKDLSRNRYLLILEQDPGMEHGFRLSE